MLSRIAAICLSLLAACYSPTQPDCGFGCGQNGECPEGYHCASDNSCHRDGTPDNLVCMVDARPDTPQPIDAPPLDADITPPTVVQTMPGNGQVNVSVNSTVYVEFSEAVTNISTSSFSLSANSVDLAGAVSAFSAFTFIFTPSAPLPSSSTITVTLTSAITDISGNALAPGTFTFQTEP